ncbi:CGNR zinc finger domain-containing protein [Dactylosporangium sp. CS-047395]|uniref:CGNR zinc finger domain-containing protein n=1 Tax=Dactylosporangium sp. CS-047395 TaxID=3239936 RepID=UPI003D92F5F6
MMPSLVACSDSTTAVAAARPQAPHSSMRPSVRNGRRRFCSTACANRVNVAAHRARQVTGWG